MSAAVTQVVAIGSTFGAFLRRDILTALSYRLPFVLDLLASSMQLAMFFFLGEIVDRADVSEGVGLTRGYFSYVVIGLVMTRMIDTALRSFSSKLRTEQTVGTFEALIATPTRLPVLVLGSAAYNLFYGMFTGAVMLLLAVGFGMQMAPTLLSAAVGVVGLLASVILFAAIGVAVAAFIVVYKQGAALLGLVTQMLSLLGGAYFPVSLFPRPLEAVAQINPLKWSLDVLRGALLDGQVVWSSLGALGVSAALLLPAALWLLRIAVDRARRDGSLAQY